MRALVLLLALAFTLPARAVEPDPAAAPAVFARESVRVAEGVWLIFKPAVTDPPFEGNVVLVEQSDGLVLIDAGGSPASGQAVAAEVRKISRKPVRWLAYTHYHGDHNLGAGAIRAAWPGVRIVSTAATRANMTGPAMDYVKTYAASYSGLSDSAVRNAADPKLAPALREGWARVARAGPGMVAGYSGMSVHPADETFAERFVIADDVAPVELAFLGRGNTDGDSIAWLPRQRVLASGDLVVAPVPYAAHTYPGDWIATLEKLEAYPFAVLIPGHGQPMRDRAYVRQVAEALATVREQVAPLAKAGAPLAEVRKRVDLAAMRRGFTGDDPWLSFLIDAVFTGDLIANAYKEALGQTVVQGKG